MENQDTPLENLAVDQVVVSKDGTKFSALSKDQIIENPYYWFYQPPSSIFKNEDRLSVAFGDNSEAIISKYDVEIAEWCECVQFLINDLTEILESSYSKFWSHVLFDEDLQHVLENYIRLAPRWFDPRCFVSSVMESLHDQLHQLVIKLFMRMSTTRESPREHITLEKFTDITKNIVYDIPRIVDICTLYGVARNGPVNAIIKKMFANVFNKIPSYLTEFTIFEKALKENMKGLKETCANTDTVSDPSKPSLIAVALLLSAGSLKSMSPEEFFEVCQASVENMVSLLHLLRHMPNSVLEMMSEVIISIPEYFEGVFLILDEELYRRTESMPNGAANGIKQMLRYGMISALETFRYNLQVRCFDKLKGDLTDDEALTVLETYYTVGMQAIPEQSFLIAYSSLYKIEDDYKAFQNHALTNALLDHSQFNYLLHTIKSASAEASVEPENLYGETVQLEDACGGGGDDEDVQNVKAIFPDLSIVFIEECLKYYNGNIDQLVAAVMDDNIHPELEKYRDFVPEEQPKAPKDVSVHIGKKNQITKDFLDDRNEKYALRKVVLQHSIVADEIEILPGANIYEDEYDDTYDSLEVGVREVATEVSDRIEGVPRILQEKPERAKKHWEIEREQEEDVEGGGERRGGPRTAFCENPEVLRARREQRYQARVASRGGKAPPQPRNVVGGPKGQGQSSEVLRNRQKKEKNKGGNRRAQADYKRKEF